MRKKIHKNLVGIAALAILLTIGLTFWAYFMMLQKQIFQDLQTDVHVLASSDYIVETLEQNYDANADGLRITLVDADGNETDFVINTDKETVGDALLEQNLIEGEEGDYGLYVKTVNGITADYDTDQTYWAFYVNGEYASTGVDSTPVNEGDTYEFKVEK